jgi:Uma2 family endonuclease
MDPVSFQSTTTMSPASFATWVRQRPSWDCNHYELLNGRIFMNPPAGFPHGEAEAKIVRAIGNAVGTRRTGKVFGSSQGFDLASGDTVEPDCSFVSSARWQAMSAPQLGEFLRVAPDLVVEILSPSTRSRDRGEKKAIYEGNDVLEYWLVDCEAGVITVFERREGRFDAGRCYERTKQLDSTVLETAFAVSELLP